jgi:hypothetical protein
LSVRIASRPHIKWGFVILFFNLISAGKHVFGMMTERLHNNFEMIVSKLLSLFCQSSKDNQKNEKLGK